MVNGMWKCPKCGRTFKHTNQDHYCGEAPVTIHEYFKKHIGLYPGSEAVQTFADRLKDYKTSKGAIQLPYDKPLTIELVSEIAKWCKRENG